MIFATCPTFRLPLGCFKFSLHVNFRFKSPHSTFVIILKSSVKKNLVTNFNMFIICAGCGKLSTLLPAEAGDRHR